MRSMRRWRSSCPAGRQADPAERRLCAARVGPPPPEAGPGGGGPDRFARPLGGDRRPHLTELSGADVVDEAADARLVGGEMTGLDAPDPLFHIRPEVPGCLQPS